VSTLKETIKNSIKESQKKPKKEVNYSLGMKKSHCGICEHFISPNKCEKVKGGIKKEYWCELFKSAR
jgi:hypothetical protein